MRFAVRGVHPVDAPEPCHLIEAELADAEDFDWGEVTQEDATQPRENWQVAYDEQPLDNDERCWAFFFPPSRSCEASADSRRPDSVAGSDAVPGASAEHRVHGAVGDAFANHPMQRSRGHRCG